MLPKQNEYMWLFECECHTHLLRVSKFENEEEIYMDKFVNEGVAVNIWSRLTLAVKYVFNPNKYSLFGDFVFKKSEARKIAQILTILTNELRSVETGNEK